MMMKINFQHAGKLGFPSIKGKKGAIGETFAMLVATILIIVILIVFFAIFKIWTAETSLKELLTGKSVSFGIQETATLESYLRSTASVDGKNISMADLIRASASDSKYKEQLSKATADFFAEYKDFNLDIQSISFSFSYPGLAPIAAGPYVASSSFSQYTTRVVITIPAKEKIAVALYKK